MNHLKKPLQINVYFIKQRHKAKEKNKAWMKRISIVSFVSYEYQIKYNVKVNIVLVLEC